MNRQQKTVVVDSLRDAFSNNAASYLVRYQGLTVTMMQQLRRELREKGGSFTVAKARLMKRAVAEVPAAHILEPYLKDQIGIVWSKQASPDIPKILKEFAAKHEQLQLIAGDLEGKLLQRKDILTLAQLPSREILLAQVCGTLNAPMVNLVSLLNTLIVRLLLVIKQVEEKKAKSA